jgi:hypothetical protein
MEKRMLEYFKFTEANELEGETWNFYVPLTEEQEARIRELIARGDEYENPYSLSMEPVSEDEVDDLMVARGTTIAVAEHNKCGSLERELPSSLSPGDDFFHKGAPFDVMETCLAPNEADDEGDDGLEDDYV